MMILKRLNFAMLGLASLSLATGAARGADPAKPDLQTQVDALTAQVQELKAMQGQSPATVTPAATPTTQTGATGLTGGWNPDSNQFYIGSTDGTSIFILGSFFSRAMMPIVADHPTSGPTALNSVAADSQRAVINEVVKQVLDRLSPSLPATSPDDPQLASLIRAWPLLSSMMKTAILSMVNAMNGDAQSQ